MKFELKTENENYSKSFGDVFKTIFSLALIILFCDLALKIRIIARNYQIDYYCRLLYVEKTTFHFKKLSNLLKLKNKQRIRDFCREFVN